MPAQLEKYRELFLDMAAISRPAITRQPAARQKPRGRAWRIATVAAAALALVAGIFAYDHYRQRQLLVALYEGSYVIDHGKRIDNLWQIRHEIKSTLAEAEQMETQAHHEQVIRDAEQDVLSGISDAAERERLKKILNE